MYDVVPVCTESSSDPRVAAQNAAILATMADITDLREIQSRYPKVASWTQNYFTGYRFLLFSFEENDKSEYNKP